jgi:hypothetical protein
MTTKVDPDLELARDIGAYALDPLGHCLFAFPWGEPGTPLEQWHRPRQWQGNILKTIGNHLQDPQRRFQPLRIAVASGHGIGKSAMAGMLSKWALDTWVDARATITANTEDQLVTKTSPEVAKWHSMAITRDWFSRATMKISSKERPESHRLDFVTWSKNNTEAFAGLHNVGKIILVITDESSSIDDAVAQVIEGALTDEGTVLIWLAMGNPTRNVGWFHAAFHKYRHRWKTVQIDARAVEGTNKVYLDELIETYGIDSDIVKVRVLGQFPSASSLQFIGSSAVEAARGRIIEHGAILPSSPVIFGLDHARFGDDSSVLAIRQGADATSRPWRKWHSATAMQIAGDVNEAMRRYLPDAVFIDAGGPNAGGVIDRLRQLNPEYQSIFEINFGSSSKDMDARWMGEVRVRVANKRAQMWTNMRAWLERGSIPGDQDLHDDLTGVEYGYTADNAILLEKKEHMKARGLASPDHGDALALTFAEEVAPRSLPEYLNPENYPKAPAKKREYDRYEELPTYSGASDYDRYSEL